MADPRDDEPMQRLMNPDYDTEQTAGRAKWEREQAIVAAARAWGAARAKAAPLTAAMAAWRPDSPQRWSEVVGPSNAAEAEAAMAEAKFWAAVDAGEPTP